MILIIRIQNFPPRQNRSGCRYWLITKNTGGLHQHKITYYKAREVYQVVESIVWLVIKQYRPTIMLFLGEHCKGRKDANRHA